MLTQLSIRDLAVVREVDIEFTSGLTTLTGETGAGKSILVEALGLALGDRADSAMIRAGADRASVTAVFDISRCDPARSLLQQHELDSADECILRRVLRPDGRSRAYCNAAAIPIHVLREIGEILIDIHGQHAHQSLLRRPVQRDLVDEFGGTGPQLEALREAYARIQSARNELKTLTGNVDDVAYRCDFLRHQIGEIDELGLGGASLADLEAAHRRFANASRIADGLDQLEASVFQADDGAAAAVGRAAGTARDLVRYSEDFGPVGELLGQASVLLDEAERELARLRSELDVDPAEAETIERNLRAIQDLARKHRRPAAELGAYRTELAAELEALEQREDRIAAAERTIEAARADYDRHAATLNQRRRKAAKKLATAVAKLLPDLGLPAARFEIEVATADDAAPGPNGTDEVEFLVTTNPDVPPRPLARVASGGELSRVSLALQVAARGGSGVPVMVYDEVDSGVGGRVADMISANLRKLATDHQVLCITHLPQIAASAAHQYAIEKQIRDGRTETRVRQLDEGERVEEIARMLAGSKITESARGHARELLSA